MLTIKVGFPFLPQCQGGGRLPQCQGGGRLPQCQGGGRLPQCQGGGRYGASITVHSDARLAASPRQLRWQM